MDTMSVHSNASRNLDMIRGLAALVVCFDHTRNMFLVDFGRVESPSPITRILYLATGYGHQAVVVFFVLSGFLISQSIIKDLRSGDWSWMNYLINRLSRLYIVLFPALLLTWIWDSAGMAYSNNAPIYFGNAEQIVIKNVAANLDLPTFLGNCAFLQSITVAPLGSNGPLWSLSNEFWYYLLFPATLCIFAANKSLHQRFVCIAIVVAIVVYCANLLPLFPIWLFGVVLALLPRIPRPRRKYAYRLMVAVATAGFLGCATLGRLNTFPVDLLADYIIGLSFSALVYVLLLDREITGPVWYRSLSARVAGMSYTLYLAHLPFLLFVFTILGLKTRYQPTLGNCLVVCAIYIVVFFYSAALAAITEAHTGKFRRFLMFRIGAPRKKIGSDP